jgi:4-amino-4-deoxy-L-arabinose transferase-like glycosyltransferase
MVETITRNSATYDEVAYARIACRWWRTGDQTEITRMGTPVSPWKFQMIPALAILDASGYGGWIDEPRQSLPQLLPWLRASATWLWFAGLWIVQAWSGRAYGHKAALVAGLLYVLGPNLRAHGAIITMETPSLTFIALSVMCLCEWLRQRRWSWFLASAGAAGFAFSMKFTAIALPVLFSAIVAGRELIRSWNRDKNRLNSVLITIRSAIRFGTVFGAIMIITNLAITGFATITPSERKGDHPWLEKRFSKSIATRLESVLETPLPVDWVGFATQMRHQSNGGPSYLLGEKSNSGWKWYYLVAMAVKCPPVILAALAIRPFRKWQLDRSEDWFIPVFCAVFIAIACVSSKRNYGYRYLLPLAPLAIVWISAMASSKRLKWCSLASVLAAGWATVACHPYELTYFNAIGGGLKNGHRILADSNLDWGQGLITFQTLLEKRPELRDVTLFAFGDIEPEIYGINVPSFLIDASDKFDHLPEHLKDVTTELVAISTSLVYGPWGPDGYFSEFSGMIPVAVTADGTIRIYRVADISETPQAPSK